MKYSIGTLNEKSNKAKHNRQQLENNILTITSLNLINPSLSSTRSDVNTTCPTEESVYMASGSPFKWSFIRTTQWILFFYGEGTMKFINWRNKERKVKFSRDPPHWDAVGIAQ